MRQKPKHILGAPNKEQGKMEVRVRDFILSLMNKDLADPDLFAQERYYLAHGLSQDQLTEIFVAAADMYQEASLAFVAVDEDSTEDSDRDGMQLELWLERLNLILELIPLPSDHHLRGNIRFLKTNQDNDSLRDGSLPLHPEEERS